MGTEVFGWEVHGKFLGKRRKDAYEWRFSHDKWGVNWDNWWMNDMFSSLSLSFYMRVYIYICILIPMIIMDQLNQKNGA